MPTYAEVFLEVCNRFQSEGMTAPWLEARVLLCKFLAIPLEIFIINEAKFFTKNELVELSFVVDRRLKGEPLARIFQVKEFYGRDFRLNDETLIPRPETELIVDCVQNYLTLFKKKEIDQYTLLELGVGSGALIVTLLSEYQFDFGVGTDISYAALNQTLENAERYGVDANMFLVQGDWANFFKKEKFGLIVSNPPYINSDEISFLEKEVKNFDPYRALNGGKDGYAAYHKISESMPFLLCSRGLLFLEIGEGQKEIIISIFEQRGLLFLECKKDLFQKERVLIFQKKEAN